MTKLDTQQLELIGTAALETQLIRQGFEVARPNRDRGIDLIIYSDNPDQPFAAVPIQLKASSGTAFGSFRKYEKFNNLILAYVWNILDEPRFFLLTHDETVQFVPDFNGLSWQKNKKYTWSNVPKKMEEQLASYENRWNLIHDMLALEQERKADII